MFGKIESPQAVKLSLAYEMDILNLCCFKNIVISLFID